MSTLTPIAQQLVAPGKGILAADESFGNMQKRFATIGVASTVETRRAYRELLFTTPGIEKCISGVILFDETIRQQTNDGVPFVDILKNKGVLPGIKVDEGLEPFGEHGEKVTKGLDGLAARLAEYVQMGAVFTKWRAVINIGNGAPTEEALTEDAHRLAEFAYLSQQAGLVPIIEPEVLLDGDHSIEESREVSKRTLLKVFQALADRGVDLLAMLLKPSMVLSGIDARNQAGDEEIATQTVEMLREVVPKTVPGIVFLSGGQSPDEATRRLALMNKMFGDTVPWQLSFSFGRALQAPVLAAWKGNPDNVRAAQTALLYQAECNSNARYGRLE